MMAGSETEQSLADEIIAYVDAHRERLDELEESATLLFHLKAGDDVRAELRQPPEPRPRIWLLDDGTVSSTL